MGLSAVVERPGWAQWMATAAPFAQRGFTKNEVSLRFEANGFEWDVHGALCRPETDSLRGVAAVLTHGGAGGEAELLETPDGRPGLAPLLAAQGVPALAVSFVGHYPRGGEWTDPPAARQPDYLLDADLDTEDIRRRNLACTLDVHVEGMARLADAALPGRKLLAFGHSTGGPMMLALPGRLKRSRVVGVLGWGSSEPSVWAREWTAWWGGRAQEAFAIDSMARRTPDWFRAAGYEDARELCPWGGAEEYTAWADRFKSQFKTGLCDNQHRAAVETFPDHARAAGLPLEAFTSCMRDPDPAWLSRAGVLLLVGENDSRLCGSGDAPATNRQIFIAEKFALRAARAKTIIVPRFGHFGFVGAHNEKIVYRWLTEAKEGFFAGA
jgi:hypothetical protein